MKARFLTFLIFWLLSINALNGQKFRFDTTFYNQQGVILNEPVDSLISAIIVYKYQGRKVVNSSKFNSEGELLQSFSYNKGQPNGRYYSWDLRDSIRINGEYKAGVRIGTWTHEDLRNGFKTITEYNNKGQIVGKSAKIENNAKFYPEEEITYAMHPEGYEYWMNYISYNLEYPLSMIKGYQYPTLKIELLVLANGRIAQIDYLNEGDFPPDLIKNMTRLIHSSMDWRPATYRGRPVNSISKLYIQLRKK